MASSREHHLGDRTLVNGHAIGRCPRVASGGSWIAANGATLERLSNDVAPQLDRAGIVKVDMAEVRELDTLGAWLLEKMSRRVTSPVHRADVIGIADNYTGLIDEVRQVNRRTPAPAPVRNPVVAKLGDIGRATIGASEDVTAFLQMLGALCIAILVLITFLIGGIIAQQGIFHFRKFGAELLRRRHGRHPRAARDRRADRRHHGRRPLGQRLHRRARLDEDARGDRRAAHHGASTRSRC